MNDASLSLSFGLDLRMRECSLFCSISKDVERP